MSSCLSQVLVGALGEVVMVTKRNRSGFLHWRQIPHVGLSWQSYWLTSFRSGLSRSWKREISRSSLGESSALSLPVIALSPEAQLWASDAESKQNLLCFLYLWSRGWPAFFPLVASFLLACVYLMPCLFLLVARFWQVGVSESGIKMSRKSDLWRCREFGFLELRGCPRPQENVSFFLFPVLYCDLIGCNECPDNG